MFRQLIYLLDNAHKDGQALHERIELLLGLLLQRRTVQAEGAGVRVGGGSLQHDLVNGALIVAVVGRRKQNHGIIPSHNLQRAQGFALDFHDFVRRIIAAQQALQYYKETDI